ncbi:MAG TPA: betaine/proline/choline family ABC transporter ATP-binding protein [Clostridia bacterium]|nr:betaine/proline/choline family ABC transporter ATP-binding protein [Clostridia bacterium]
MIELKDVTKYYEGQKNPAVKNLTLAVEEGETCVFVGPSGCGKSTTLRMINRLIDPTSGEILINGENIKDKDPDRLRMSIGYVIQQIGLLPHRTVAENVAIVPRLYGWPKEDINQRVDELLELVGLDIATTKDKYPSQLSGGQMQRVGVARAMAADPPIMLMDEPFGAVDPIIRNYLQDEFLRLQKEMRKTICFVTHDINEAIKMGDKIVIFKEGELIQHGTPHDILTKPINKFVSDFIGYDRVIKMLSLYKVRRLSYPVQCTVGKEELADAIKKMNDLDAEICFVVNDDGGACGFIAAKDVLKAGGDLSVDQLEDMVHRNRDSFIDDMAYMRDALSLMLELDTDYLGVLDSGGLAGFISLENIRLHSCKKEGV